MELSIIVVSWNTRQLLQECLESIYKNTTAISYEIIVIDNASNDGSVEMVRSLFGNVIIVENKENLGFAKANNIAFPLAVGRYVLLLNSDTLVQPNALDFAVDFLNKNEDVGGLTPKILNSDGTIQHPGYIKEPSLETEIFEAFNFEKLLGIKRKDIRAADESTFEVAHACGCSLFIKKEVLDKIGYLDDRMIFSFEDVDICMRIRRSGWKILYLPTSHIIHFGGGSRSKHNNRAVNAMLQSKYAFYNKYHGRVYVLAITLCILLSALIKLLVNAALLIQFSKKKERISSLKIYWSILRWHLQMLKAQKRDMGT
jgi:GT2 family glycosyltransferase